VARDAWSSASNGLVGNMSTRNGGGIGRGSTNGFGAPLRDRHVVSSLGFVGPRPLRPALWGPGRRRLPTLRAGRRGEWGKTVWSSIRTRRYHAEG